MLALILSVKDSLFPRESGGPGPQIVLPAILVPLFRGGTRIDQAQRDGMARLPQPRERRRQSFRFGRLLRMIRARLLHRLGLRAFDEARIVEPASQTVAFL